MRSSFFLLAGLTVLLLLNGCSWLGIDDWFAASPQVGNPVDEQKLAELNKFPYEQMAPEAPPEPKEEKHGHPPGNVPDEYTWRDGHWEYADGNGFNWKSGYWLRKPAFSAAWRQDVWMQRAYGWTFVPGHWE